MSESNVALHRRAIEAFNARDLKVLIALCDPTIEFHSVFAAVGGATYLGHDGVRTFFRDLADAWDDIRLEPEAFFDLGEHTLFFFVNRGRGQHSGADVAMALTQVARWRDGLLVYLKSYMQRQHALLELGVSEDQLERIEP
jgi:ketosteroid isomerase-like protein